MFLSLLLVEFVLGSTENTCKYVFAEVITAPGCAENFDLTHEECTNFLQMKCQDKCIRNPEKYKFSRADECPTYCKRLNVEGVEIPSKPRGCYYNENELVLYNRVGHKEIKYPTLISVCKLTFKPMINNACPEEQRVRHLTEIECRDFTRRVYDNARRSDLIRMKFDHGFFDNKPYGCAIEHRDGNRIISYNENEVSRGDKPGFQTICKPVYQSATFRFQWKSFFQVFW